MPLEEPIAEQPKTKNFLKNVLIETLNIDLDKTLTKFELEANEEFLVRYIKTSVADYFSLDSDSSNQLFEVLNALYFDKSYRFQNLKTQISSLHNFITNFFEERKNSNDDETLEKFIYDLDKFLDNSKLKTHSISHFHKPPYNKLTLEKGEYIVLPDHDYRKYEEYSYLAVPVVTTDLISNYMKHISENGFVKFTPKSLYHRTGNAAIESIFRLNGLYAGYELRKLGQPVLTGEHGFRANLFRADHYGELYVDKSFASLQNYDQSTWFGNYPISFEFKVEEKPRLESDPADRYTIKQHVPLNSFTQIFLPEKAIPEVASLAAKHNVDVNLVPVEWIYLRQILDPSYKQGYGFGDDQHGVEEHLTYIKKILSKQTPTKFS
jgi:hypothetical protein